MDRRTFTTAIAASAASLIAPFAFGAKKDELAFTIDHERGVVKLSDPMSVEKTWVETVDIEPVDDHFIKLTQHGQSTGFGELVPHCLFAEIIATMNFRTGPNHAEWTYTSILVNAEAHPHRTLSLFRKGPLVHPAIASRHALSAKRLLNLRKSITS